MEEKEVDFKKNSKSDKPNQKLSFPHLEEGRDQSFSLIDTYSSKYINTTELKSWLYYKISLSKEASSGLF